MKNKLTVPCRNHLPA